MTAAAPGRLSRLRRPLLALLIATWIGAAVATHIPPGSVPETGVSDKSLHVLGYFVLGSLLLVTLAGCGVGRARRVALLLGALAVYGALDEITQPLVGRNASVYDWLADVSGAALAVVVCELVLALAARRRRAAGGRP